MGRREELPVADRQQGTEMYEEGDDCGDAQSHPKHRKLAVGQTSHEPEEFARSYQLEALEKAKKENTIVFLETGSGKTLIAIMLLRSYAHQLRKPSRSVAVFLVPTVVLVKQQGEVVEMHTDLKVRKLWGDMGTDFWTPRTWVNELNEYEVFVMTPAILLRNLQHSFFKLEMIKLLIFDECHNARGNSAYARIMKEFYHKQLRASNAQLPRILGMTASPIKSKGSTSREIYAKHILELEILLNSKVYTVANESTLAKFIPFSTPKVKMYDEHVDLPCEVYPSFATGLLVLKEKHLHALKGLHLQEEATEGARRRIEKLYDTFLYCLTELGAWLALKAADCILAGSESEIFFWEQKKDVLAEKCVRNFSQDVKDAFSKIVPSDWCIGEDERPDLYCGLLTAKVNCLIQSLAEYRSQKNLRCIIFVERVITAIVIQIFLSSLQQLLGWKIKHMAGNQSRIQSQSRKEQMTIVDAFREGAVNIIVATQILEEGLDVQKCNLVIRFDPSNNVCSFIQSRGRARMQGSDYLLLVKRGDSSTLSRIKNYLRSGDIMREESLRQASVPCPLPDRETYDEDFYLVETTGAVVTLSSSISLIYFYCSKLPSDGYFKPLPRFDIDENDELCTLNLPKSCPVQTVSVHGPVKMLRKIACLEACRKLHEIGALTDNLLPELDAEEDSDAVDSGNNFCDQHEDYFPEELVDNWPTFSKRQLYYCYLMSLNQNFEYDISFGDIILVVKSPLDDEVTNTEFQLKTDRGFVAVNMKYVGTIHLTTDQVNWARRFQITILGVLVDHNWSKLEGQLKGFSQDDTLSRINYLVLPSTTVDGVHGIDWDCVRSASFYSGLPSHRSMVKRSYGSSLCSCAVGSVHLVQTNDNLVCRCILRNSLVVTPHNGHIYCVTGILYDINAASTMKSPKDLTYKEYFQSRHNCFLHHESEPLLSARHLCKVRNFLHKCLTPREKDLNNATVELPPELCLIIMSPISANTLYSFSFVPSIMHRVNAMLLAVRLKQMQMHHYPHNVIPAIKVLEAITSKKCQEEFSYESLETLGDSFLKYAASQQLFRDNKHHHEGILTAKRERMISNSTLYKLGCNHKLVGFIRNEQFNPKEWAIPGELHEALGDHKEVLLTDSRMIYSRGTRLMKIKRVADVVEALIGAYLSSAGELAALQFMNSLGMKINFANEVPHDGPLLARPENYVNVLHLEHLLKYTFHNASLLVEALTHGSYQVSDICPCYQRLEFLGDAVLDYLMTKHLFDTYPGLSPGLLTDLRSASVNNDCYAHAAVKSNLNKHILHTSSTLYQQITSFVHAVNQSTSNSFFGWEANATTPKALGDIIESIAGAILFDSGFNKHIVWNSIRPLLEPLVTPDTIKYHPVKELEDICRRNSYQLEFEKTNENGVAAMTAEVIANGSTHRKTCTGVNKETAKKLVAKALLESLRESKLNI